ncbi:hypothetical protein NTGBS_160027 [Candidatus Nitrotoga sp. BS]|nr:hypothetical protein NTGBS_160027 [Candidatus Nitrotoga sp. BS]
MPAASVVDYLVMHENEQPLVSKYRQVLPVEDELPAELKKGTAMAGRTKMK